MNKSKLRGKGGPSGKRSTQILNNKSDDKTSSKDRNSVAQKKLNSPNTENLPKSGNKTASATGNQLSSSSPSASNIMTIAPPSPQPLFTLSEDADRVSSITAVQFINPALRLESMSQSHAETLCATYGNLEPSDLGALNISEVKNSKATIIRTPPPGFLHLTTYLTAGTQDGDIIIWDLKTKEQLLKWRAHGKNGAVITLKSISPNQLISYGRSDSVKLWYLVFPGEQPKASVVPAEPAEENVFEGKTIKAICTHKIKVANYAGFSGCDIFKHYGVVVTAIPGPFQDIVTVWKLNGEVKIVELSVNEVNKVGSVMHLKWVEKRTVLALLVAYESGDMCVWDWSNKNIHSTACIKDNPVCFEYDQYHGCGVIGTVSEKIYPFSINSSFQITINRCISITNEGIGACLSRPDSKIYVTGGWDNKIRVYSWQKNRLLAVLSHHKSSISSVHFSPSKITSIEASINEDSSVMSSLHYLAAGSTDGCVSVWKIF